MKVILMKIKLKSNITFFENFDEFALLIKGLNEKQTSPLHYRGISSAQSRAGGADISSEAPTPLTMSQFPPTVPCTEAPSAPDPQWWAQSHLPGRRV